MLKENNPIPPDMQLPCPFSGNGEPPIPIPAENNPISPEMQSPPHFRDGDPQYPIPADTPIPPELRLPPPLVLNRAPPIPPMPENYKKTTIKDLEKKDKELKKSIISLERQLEKLNFEKAHIECCLDYFQMEQDNFMETVENYHTTSTPQSSPPSSPRSCSPLPLPVPPRPSFLQCMATSFLSAVPKDNSWSRCDNDIRTYSFYYTCPGTGRANESDPPLPESFPLFNGRRTPSPRPIYIPSPPDSPITPRKPRNPTPTYRGQCLCYDCIHGNGCKW